MGTKQRKANLLSSSSSSSRESKTVVGKEELNIEIDSVAASRGVGNPLTFFGLFFTPRGRPRGLFPGGCEGGWLGGSFRGLPLPLPLPLPLSASVTGMPAARAFFFFSFFVKCLEFFLRARGVVLIHKFSQRDILQRIL